MKVLVLSFYFRPDLCAGSFRNTSFVESLQKIKKIKHIDVVSTMPIALDLPLNGTDAPVQVLEPTSKETFEIEIAINANVKTTKPLLAP